MRPEREAGSRSSGLFLLGLGFIVNGPSESSKGLLARGVIE